MNNKIVGLSKIDTDRYGVQIARTRAITEANLPDILNFCRDNSVQMLIARCSTSELTLAQTMEQSGFLLMDTLVYYMFKYDRADIPENRSQIPVRKVKPGDEVQIEQTARDAFQGYFGHYHADPYLEKTKADEAYISWAVRSCLNREVADEVLIAEIDNQIAGFATLRMNSPEEGEGVLFGVAPRAQGQGIYRSFMIEAMKWVKEQGAKQIIVSTQVNNIAVQKVWSRLGFTIYHSCYTFHKWFDK